jgi:hypothetical protein
MMKFEYKQKVKILPLDNLTGRIVEISIKDAVTYSVEYYINCEQKRIW